MPNPTGPGSARRFPKGNFDNSLYVFKTNVRDLKLIEQSDNLNQTHPNPNGIPESNKVFKKKIGHSNFVLNFTVSLVPNFTGLLGNRNRRGTGVTTVFVGSTRDSLEGGC